MGRSAKALDDASLGDQQPAVDFAWRSGCDPFVVGSPRECGLQISLSVAMIEQDFFVKVQGTVSAPSGAVCNPNTDAIDTFLVAIGGFPDQMLRSATALGSALVGEGMLLLTYAFLATVAISLYRNLIVARGLEELLFDVVRACILGSITLALLNNWGSVSQILPNWINNSVISKLTTGNEPASVIGQFYAVFAEMFREMTAWIQTGAKPCGDAQGGILASLQSLWDTITLKTIMDVIWMYVALGLAILIIIVPLTLFSAIMLAVLFGNALIMKIAIIFGPVMIAWIPFAPMAWLAMSWLRFMLITAVTVAIAYLIAGLLASSMLPVFRTLLNTGVNATGIGYATIWMGASIALVLLFGSWMLTKADDIASGLIGGGGASSGATFVSSLSRTVQQIKMASKGGGGGGGGRGTGGGASGGGARGRAGGGGSGVATPSASAVSGRAGAAGSTP